MCWYLCIENVFDWHLWAFFLFGLVKLISGYQNLKSTCPKGYQGFWNFASPASTYDQPTGHFLSMREKKKNLIRQPQVWCLIKSASGGTPTERSLTTWHILHTKMARAETDNSKMTGWLLRNLFKNVYSFPRCYSTTMPLDMTKFATFRALYCFEREVNQISIN